MDRPVRILVRWRALPELKSHFDLFLWIAEHLPAEILILSETKIPWIDDDSPLYFARARESLTFHPATLRLTGWTHSAQTFQPDIVLALDEAYCYSTYQLVRWAMGRGLPSIYLSCQNIDRPLPLPFLWMERRTLRGISGGWFLNEEAGERARKRGFQGEGKVIPLPVDPKDYPRLARPDGGPQERKTSDRFTVGYVGRLVPEKGVGTLIEACAKTGDRLLIAGEGPEREPLERLAKSLAVEAEWLGSIPSEEVPKVYTKMDALVLPSLETPKWKEQFGRVLVEAMASGVPAIGSRSGEIPNVIGDAGLLFTPGDSEELGERLQRLRESPTWRKELGEKCLRRVHEKFTLAKVGQTLSDLVQVCLSR